jgi:transcriptional regulator NrdR family protein
MVKPLTFELTCPSCGKTDISVYDGHPSTPTIYRRRRRCLSCQYRWVTYEINIDELAFIIDGVFARSTLVAKMIKVLENEMTGAPPEVRKRKKRE